jgi:hypothetical protein
MVKTYQNFTPLDAPLIKFKDTSPTTLEKLLDDKHHWRIRSQAAKELSKHIRKSSVRTHSKESENAIEAAHILLSSKCPEAQMAVAELGISDEQAESWRRYNRHMMVIATVSGLMLNGLMVSSLFTVLFGSDIFTALEYQRKLSSLFPNVSSNLFNTLTGVGLGSFAVLNTILLVSAFQGTVSELIVSNYTRKLMPEE